MTPLVSIICITYNHAEFIESAIEGFISQKTNFPYEIIIHDDCSTDGTTEIIKQYSQKYPDLIRPFYEDVNCFSRGIKVLHRLMCDEAKGKYIAICEGDDYWCDPHKLQKQVNYMEEHDNCSLVLHNGYQFDYDVKSKTPIDPYEKDGIISDKDIILEPGKMPPTASMMWRKKDLADMPQLFQYTPVGDRTRRMYLILKGYTYYMSDIMCVYRVGVPGSFGKRTVENQNYNKKVLDGMLDFYDKYDEYTHGKFKEEIELVKSREWYHFYRRSGQHMKAFKTDYFKNHFTCAEKIKYLVSVILPNPIKKIIKKYFIK